MSEQAKITCPECGRKLKPRKDGKTRWHLGDQRDAWGYRRLCIGVDRPPAREVTDWQPEATT